MKVTCKDGFQQDEVLGIVGYLEDEDQNEVGSVEIKFQKITLNVCHELHSIHTDAYESDDQDCIDEVKETLFEPFDLEPDDQLISNMIETANNFELHFE